MNYLLEMYFTPYVHVQYDCDYCDTVVQYIYTAVVANTLLLSVCINVQPHIALYRIFGEFWGVFYFVSGVQMLSTIVTVQSNYPFMSLKYCQ